MIARGPLKRGSRIIVTIGAQGEQGRIGRTPANAAAA